jgi:hypothetical protein
MYLKNLSISLKMSSKRIEISKKSLKFSKNIFNMPHTFKKASNSQKEPRSNFRIATMGSPLLYYTISLVVSQDQD